MVAQVGLLTKGMTEIPANVLSLQPRTCLVSKIEADSASGKKQSHPWDQLPGKKAGALKRVVARPPTYVSNLNPKTADPWSLPHLVSVLLLQQYTILRMHRSYFPPALAPSLLRMS